MPAAAQFIEPQLQDDTYNGISPPGFTYSLAVDVLKNDLPAGGLRLLSVERFRGNWGNLTVDSTGSYLIYSLYTDRFAPTTITDQYRCAVFKRKHRNRQPQQQAYVAVFVAVVADAGIQVQAAGAAAAAAAVAASTAALHHHQHTYHAIEAAQVHNCIVLIRATCHKHKRENPP